MADQSRTTPRYLQVTEAETTKLIAASGPERPLMLAFGPARVALDTHRSAWAVPLLQEMRHVA